MDAKISLYIISVLMILVGVIFLVLVTVYPCEAESFYNCSNGWIAVIGAAIVFGSTGIPMKSKNLNQNDIDPLVFAVFTGLGIFIVNLPLLIYLIYNKEFIFDLWAMLGSTDIFFTGYFAFQAVQIFGFAKASATWAGTGMVISFLWGKFAFHEIIINEVYAITALILLVSGVVLVSTSQTAMTDDNNSNDEIVFDEITDRMIDDDINLNTIRKKHDNSLLLVSNKSNNVITYDTNSNNNKIDLYETNDNNNSNIMKNIFGYILCFTTGFFDGSLAVPFKLTNTTNLINVYNYLASFGVSSLLICPALYLLYKLITQTKITYESIYIASIPGLLSGILWALANILSIHATYYLGMKVGFPLTQTCIIITAGWGILYFKEIIIAVNSFNFVKFCFGVCIIIVGSYFLAMSSA